MSLLPLGKPPLRQWEGELSLSKEVKLLRCSEEGLEPRLPWPSEGKQGVRLAGA